MNNIKENQKVLITGATGFLGSSLVELLLSKGLSVIAIGRKDRGYLKNWVLSHSNFTFIKLDLLSVDKLLQYDGKGVTAIFHLASLQPSKRKTYEDFYLNNVVISSNLIQFAKKYKINQIIYSSTTAVFSNKKNETICESLGVNPISYYGLTKYIAEKIIEIECAASKIKSTIIRFPSLYGIDHLGGIVHTLTMAALENKDIELYGEGKKFRNIVYVNNAVGILYNSFVKVTFLEDHELFILGSKDSLSLFEIAELIINITESKSKLIPIKKYNQNDFDIIIDNSKVVNKLYFKPITIEEGLRKYIKDLKDENI